MERNISMVSTLLKKRARKILHRFRPPASSKGEALRLWQVLSARPQLEIVTDLYDIPAVVAHRNSTAVVYANAAAQELFGQDLVGRTVKPEAANPSQPICYNGLPVNGENHPGLLLEAEAPVRRDVVWSAGGENRRFVLDAQPMLKNAWDNGDFYLMTFNATA